MSERTLPVNEDTEFITRKFASARKNTESPVAKHYAMWRRCGPADLSSRPALFPSLAEAQPMRAFRKKAGVDSALPKEPGGGRKQLISRP